jgi:hypothetical protein
MYIERELESSAKTKASTPLPKLILRRRSEQLSVFGIIFTHVLFAKGEKVVNKKGLYFTQSIGFWRFMPKGEKVLAQSKRTAPPPNFKTHDFQIGILLCSKGGESSTFKNWYLKTLLNTKRKIY